MNMISESRMRKTIKDRARKDLLRGFFYIGIAGLMMIIIFLTLMK